MIEWRLRVVMAERCIGVQDLAELTGMNRVTISRLKNTTTMPPRLTAQTLNSLCKVLKCQPADLLTYVEENEAA
ncbi:MAG: helix-turn-helix transcriptional regulator [Symploca sp. SIO1C4]|uniref:Helix-turn-helix transcriptional regulator n=1 Tax=Symploca sp. SIO1C4 TaxID=2607765 RepID=A0A6B3NG90_9CYAN|nr:helix-turn-helix transcriptional regulator [Symploca sp. SIO1C4]